MSIRRWSAKKHDGAAAAHDSEEAEADEAEADDTVQWIEEQLATPGGASGGQEGARPRGMPEDPNGQHRPPAAADAASASAAEGGPSRACLAIAMMAKRAAAHERQQA